MKRAVKLEIAELLESRPYRLCAERMEIEGIPWLPLIGRNSVLRTTEPSPWHSHKGCIEVVYCKHGNCEYESCGQVFRLTPGRVFVSRPNEPHRAMSNPKGLDIYYLLFKVAGKGEKGMLAKEIGFIERKLRKMPRLFDGGSRTGSHFVRLFRLIGQKFESREERRLRILNACLSVLMSVIDASAVPMAEGGSMRIMALADEMRAAPERDYPIDALATRIGFSISSLIIGFKAAIGYTPHAYLVKCRIDRAKELLKSGAASVTEISEKLGFSSPQHFATQFRNATGMSPHEWGAAQTFVKAR